MGKVFWLLFLVSLLMSLGNNIIIPIVPVYAETFRLTSSEIGNVVSYFMLPGIFLQLISGSVLRSGNRKLILETAIAVIAASYAILWNTDSIFWLKLARFMHGVGVSFTVTSCLSLVIDSLDKKVMDRGITVFGLAETFTGTLGASLALMIINRIGYDWLFKIAFCLMVAAMAAALPVKDRQETKNFEFSLNSVYDPRALPPTLLTVIQYIINNVISTFIIIYMSESGVINTGMFFIIQSVSLLVSKPLLTSMLLKTDKARLLKLSFISNITCLVLLFFGKPYLFMAAAVFSGFSSGWSSPLMQSLCIQSVDEQKQSIAIAMSYFAVGAGGVIGANGSGILAESIGYSRMYLMTVLLVVVNWIILEMISRRTAKKE